MAELEQPQAWALPGRTWPGGLMTDPIGMMPEAGGAEITWDGSPGESGAIDLTWE